jgi:hypothetical protein
MGKGSDDDGNFAQCFCCCFYYLYGCICGKSITRGVASYIFYTICSFIFLTIVLGICLAFFISGGVVLNNNTFLGCKSIIF